MRTALFAAAFVLIALPSAAYGQLGGTVTVLLPEQFQVDEEIALEFYERLVEAVNQNPDFTLTDLPPQTLQDLGLAIGCTGDHAECLGLLGEIMESDFIITGEIGRTGETYLIDLSVWDVAFGDTLYQYTKGVEGDLARFQELMPVLARGAVYGPVGEIEITVDPPDAQVELDAILIDREPPIFMTGLELGPHVIRVHRDDYFDYREEVIIDLDLLTVNVVLEPFTEQVEVTGGRVWTWVLLGTGIALGGAGTAFAISTQSSQDEFDAEASQIRVDEARLQELQDEGETNALLTNILLGAGGAAIVAAVVMFFVEGPSEEVPVRGGRATGPIRPDVSGSGYGVTLDIEF